MKYILTQKETKKDGDTYMGNLFSSRYNWIIKVTKLLDLVL